MQNLHFQQNMFNSKISYRLHSTHLRCLDEEWIKTANNAVVVLAPFYLKNIFISAPESLLCLENGTN